MNLRIVEWNAEGMFVAGTLTRRATPSDAVATLKRLDADVVVIPEFGIINKLAETTDVALRALGYEKVTTEYRDSRACGTGIALLSRLPIVSHQAVEIGEVKAAIDARIRTDRGIIRVVAVHLDDRAETLRLKEVNQLIQHLATAPGVPTILLGDFNAMRRSSRFAKLARGTIAAAAERTISHKKLHSMISRVREMATGTTIAAIEEGTNLHSLDPGLQRTISARQDGLKFAPTTRLAKIDWIFGSPEITTVSYRVSKDVGSDHRPVIAEIRINE